MTLGQVDIPPLHGTVADMLAHKSSVVHAVPPDTTVLEAIAQMDSKRVGALLVMQGEQAGRHRFGARLHPQGDPAGPRFAGTPGCPRS